MEQLRTSNLLWNLLLLAMVPLAITACAGPLRANASESAGRATYLRYCSECHGQEGERIPVAPLSSTEFLNQRGDVGLILSVREGKATMSAWSKELGGPLSDSEVTDVLAYINSMARRESPLALASKGRELFRSKCASCHGENGDRIPTARLTSEEFLAGRTDAALSAAIGSGGKGSMPPQAKDEGGSMSASDIEAVVAFLRSRNIEQQAVLAGRGRDIYSKRCLSCHGERGDQFPKAPLNAASFLEGRGDGVLGVAVSLGSPGMPAFSSVKGGPLSPDDVEAVLLYLKVWAGMPAKVAFTGVGAAAESKDLYVQNCAPCHGDKGDKVANVRLMSSEFLGKRGEAALVQTVRRGNSKGMPSWSKDLGGSLSDESIAALVRLLLAGAGASGQAPTDTVSSDPRGPATESASRSATSATAPAPAASGSAAADGEALFGKNCAVCHGASRDKMPTARLADSAWLAQRGEDVLASSIATGKGGMPAFGAAKGGSFSDGDIRSILAYLKQSAGGSAQSETAGATPASPAPPRQRRTEPVAITPDIGRELYAKNCAMCHGADGMQVRSAPLGSKRYVSNRRVDAFLKKIGSGVPAAGMPAWSEEKGGPLAREEILAIVDYLAKSAR